jgi:hypothetical protein
MTTDFVELHEIETCDDKAIVGGLKWTRAGDDHRSSKAAAQS